MSPLAPIACLANWRHLPPSQANSCAAQFSPAERRRLEHFTHDEARHQFIAGRCLARGLLSLQAPEILHWQLAASGPPRLAQRPGWQLSLSHSGDWVAAALSPQPIGIDLEADHRPRRHLAIARRYFHDEEAQALALLSEPEREDLFLHMWTAREAYLKALEVGLADGLKRLRVEPVAGAPPRVVLCDGNQGWQFRYHRRRGLLACIAWQGPPLTLGSWCWRRLRMLPDDGDSASVAAADPQC